MLDMMQGGLEKLGESIKHAPAHESTNHSHFTK